VINVNEQSEVKRPVMAVLFFYFTISSSLGRGDPTHFDNQRFSTAKCRWNSSTGNVQSNTQLRGRAVRFR
jgi:hypothetical protein